MYYLVIYIDYIVDIVVYLSGIVDQTSPEIRNPLIHTSFRNNLLITSGIEIGKYYSKKRLCIAKI